MVEYRGLESKVGGNLKQASWHFLPSNLSGWLSASRLETTSSLPLTSGQVKAPWHRVTDMSWFAQDFLSFSSKSLISQANQGLWSPYFELRIWALFATESLWQILYLLTDQILESDQRDQNQKFSSSPMLAEPTSHDRGQKCQILS